MKQPNPRLKSVLRFQQVAMIFNVIIATAVGYFATKYFAGNEWYFMALVGISSSYITAKILNVLTLILAQMVYYGKDIQEVTKDAADFLDSKPIVQEVKSVAFSIVSMPDTPIGKFMDTDFYEWIILDDGGEKPFKATFLRTVVKPENYDLETGQIMLPPGIVYQVDPV